MNKPPVKLLLTALTTSLLLSGCVLPGMSTRNDFSGLPPIQTFADDIHDIMMPAEMEWDRARSMAIKTESFHGGVWHYSGKVETMSLKDYMLNAMQDAKWKLVGEAASSDIMFAFVKPHKTCMMVISEGDFRSTRLTLYVTIDKTAAVKLNPFGEPAAPLAPPQKQKQEQESAAPSADQQAVSPLDDLSY